ncbi:MAG TPA: SHOCT domain-containing protein, partial [Streptosporangiaceae bacterium]|nr:SHOCT domain-containing protein [Streptosporangiaceae bacterium]
ELPIHMESGEIGKLAEALRSGDPAARQAAMERLRELRDRARNRTAHEVAGPKPAAEGFSGSSGPGSFDDIGGPGPQATPGDAFGEPAGFSSFHEPAGFSPVGQPAAPGPRAPTPSTFSAFDTSGGQGSVEERLARLKQLLDKGIVTESEFQAQRQQIINGI